MNTIQRLWQSLPWRRACWFVLVAVLCLTAVSPAWAKGKKVEEEAAPTKSYTVPYMIVMTLMGLGLMTVLRPGKRLEKAEDQLVSDEDE